MGDHAKTNLSYPQLGFNYMVSYNTLYILGVIYFTLFCYHHSSTGHCIYVNMVNIISE